MLLLNTLQEKGITNNIGKTNLYFSHLNFLLYFYNKFLMDCYTGINGRCVYQGNTQQRSRNDKTNLGVLLNEFFELYGINLNYKTVAVRVREGPFVMKGQVGICCYLHKK